MFCFGVLCAGYDVGGGGGADPDRFKDVRRGSKSSYVVVVSSVTSVRKCCDGA